VLAGEIAVPPFFPNEPIQDSQLLGATSTIHRNPLETTRLVERARMNCPRAENSFQHSTRGGFGIHYFLSCRTTHVQTATLRDAGSLYPVHDHGKVRLFASRRVAVP
jgi:hypothetical protein